MPTFANNPRLFANNPNLFANRLATNRPNRSWVNQPSGGMRMGNRGQPGSTSPTPIPPTTPSFPAPGPWNTYWRLGADGLYHEYGEWGPTGNTSPTDPNAQPPKNPRPPAGTAGPYPSGTPGIEYYRMGGLTGANPTPYNTNPWSQPNSDWRSLPGGINYNELPWFNYLQGGRELPYWRGPQGMPYPSAQSWNRLSPSEQGMYQGMLETQGVYWPDFMNKMQRLAPSWSSTLPQVNWR